jgi:signal transduction histidine kinase
LSLTVADNGDGFDPAAPHPAAPHPGHLGLSTMAQRAGLIGADLTVASAPGQGTTVTVALPYDQPNGSDNGRPG